MMEPGHSDMVQPILLIGIGDTGTAAAERLHQRFPDRTELLIMDRSDTDRPVLMASGQWMALDAPDPARWDHVAAGRAVSANRDQLVHFLQGSSTLVAVFAGLGDPAGAGATPALAAILNEIDRHAVYFVVMPDRATDGRKREMIAALARNDLERQAGNLMQFSAGTSAGEGTAENGLDVMIGKAAIFLEIALERGDIAMDVSWVLNSAIRHELAIAGASSSGQDRVETAARSILQDQTIQRVLRRPAKIHLDVVGGEDFTLWELNETASYLSANWGADVDIAFSTNIRQEYNGSVKLGVIVDALI